MQSDRVILTVPARGEFAKTVRMTAAELASRIGMTYDDVDDVRMAAEEAFVYACDRVSEGSDVSFALELGEDSLTFVVGPFECDAAATDGAAGESYAEFILQSVCDEYSVDRDGSGCTLRLVKRATSSEDARV